ncbi:hypothetical protein PMAYCL1PPCAC_22720 [Pristionchus mayeri]|uniref:Biogenesis of lysosome-related organelles complex 1 subunit 5 n=1 Tax=Pristionchus mayeri TaxID=1317129 RepID=A0AAN5CYC3_9BILA|nr:hypothetical protein PMAYCL1PPCAC_22720 [Pristionchus mayeri]
MEGAVKEVALLGQNLFDHKEALAPVIKKFIDNFEKNDRHKEFDGILRASHSLVEAASTASDRLLADGRLEQLNARVNSLAARLEHIAEQPAHAKEHAEYLAGIQEEQDEYVRLCEAEGMRKMRIAAGLEQDPSN